MSSQTLSTPASANKTGIGTVAWTNATAANGTDVTSSANDATPATAVLLSGQVTNYLKLSYASSSSFPSNANIDEIYITPRMKCLGALGNATLSKVYLWNTSGTDAIFSGSDYATITSLLTTFDYSQVVSSGDTQSGIVLWSCANSALRSAIIAGTLGCALSFTANANTTVSVSAVDMRIKFVGTKNNKGILSLQPVLATAQRFLNFGRK